MVFNVIIRPDEELFMNLETTFVLSGLYLFFCKLLGPRYMKDREPMSWRAPMLLYSSLQIIMNLQLLYMCYSLLGLKAFSFWSKECNPVANMNSNRNIEDKVLALGNYFLANKVFDLLDTVFFILRKKTKQATREHIIHHSVAVIVAGLSLKLNVTEELIVKMISYNAPVHAILHIYYLLSALSQSSYQKYLYIKKYLTALNIIELIIVLTMLVMNLVYCQLSPVFLVIWFSYIGALLFLFSNYYRVTYMNENKNE